MNAALPTGTWNTTIDKLDPEARKASPRFRADMERVESMLATAIADLNTIMDRYSKPMQPQLKEKMEEMICGIERSIIAFASPEITPITRVHFMDPRDRVILMEYSDPNKDALLGLIDKDGFGSIKSDPPVVMEKRVDAMLDNMRSANIFGNKQPAIDQPCKMARIEVTYLSDMQIATGVWTTGDKRSLAAKTSLYSL